jgi:hypothetical protein
MPARLSALAKHRGDEREGMVDGVVDDAYSRLNESTHQDLQDRPRMILDVDVGEPAVVGSVRRVAILELHQHYTPAVVRRPHPPSARLRPSWVSGLKCL